MAEPTQSELEGMRLRMLEQANPQSPGTIPQAVGDPVDGGMQPPPPFYFPERLPPKTPPDLSTREFKEWFPPEQLEVGTRTFPSNVAQIVEIQRPTLFIATGQFPAVPDVGTVEAFYTPRTQPIASFGNVNFSVCGAHGRLWIPAPGTYYVIFRAYEFNVGVLTGNPVQVLQIDTTSYAYGQAHAEGIGAQQYATHPGALVAATSRRIMSVKAALEAEAVTVTNIDNAAVAYLTWGASASASSSLILNPAGTYGDRMTFRATDGTLTAQVLEAFSVAGGEVRTVSYRRGV